MRFACLVVGGMSLGAVCGCPAAAVVAPHVEPEPTLIAEPLLPPLAVSIARPATAYNEPFETSPPTALAEAVRGSLRELAGTTGEVTGDPRLDRACSEIAAVLTRIARPSPALIEFVLRSHGIAEPAAHVLVAWTAAVPELVIAAMQPELRDAVVGRVRAGVGTVDGGPVIAIFVHQTGIDLVATPRAVALHEGFELVATVDPRIESPTLTTMHDDGTIEHPAGVLDDGGRTFHAPFSCGDHTGRQWIEIDATGLGGTLPRAVVPILCGGAWPSRFAIEPSGNLMGLVGPGDIERRLTSIINRQRARAGRRLLRTDPRLAASARQHVTAIRDARAAGTAVPTGAAGARLRAAGVVPLIVQEGFLEVDSVEQAAEELMNQDDYRVQLQAPDVTDVGVGVARADAGGHLLITVTYAGFTPLIDAPAVSHCLEDAIDAMESSREDPALSRVARRYAEGLARGARREQLWPDIAFELDAAAHGRFDKIGVAVVTVVDVTALAARELTHGKTVDDVGVGVAQSPRYGAQGGVITVVAFLAQRRFRVRVRLDDDPEAAAHRACLAAASGRVPAAR